MRNRKLKKKICQQNFDRNFVGLSPSTKYRVTVRAKHLRAVGQAPPPGPPPEEAPGAYTDFRTLAKGLPDPPQVSSIRM